MLHFEVCLRLFLDGNRIGHGTHLSLFLVIMKSEYDDILRWPFQKNQKDRSKDHAEQMLPDKDSASFQKPTKEMNIAIKYPLFIQLDRLRTEGFLKNENIFLEIKIE